MSGFREELKTRCIVWAGTPLLRAWFSTVRLHQVTPHLYRRVAYPQGDQFIVATWHRCAIFFVNLFGPIHPMIMFSRSRDGELFARFAQKVGAEVVRGSSSRGGAEALRHMAKFLERTGRHCATVVDGPRGPAFKSKPGLVALAQISGVPLLPMVWSSPNPITLTRTWDRTTIPRPFGKVTLICGEPFHVPKGGRRVLVEYNRLLEDRLNELMNRADRICGYHVPA